jgi:hypothetical protein
VDFIVEGQREENHSLDNDQPNNKNFALPADISPVTEMLPTASISDANSFSRRGSAALITGSPQKQKLLNCMKKNSANHSSEPKKAPGTQRKKRTRMPSSSSSDEWRGWCQLTMRRVTMKQILSVSTAESTIRGTSMVKSGYIVPNATYGAPKKFAGAERKKEISFAPVVFSE